MSLKNEYISGGVGGKKPKSVTPRWETDENSTDSKQINKHYNHTYIKKRTKYLEFIPHKNYKFVQIKK